MHFCINLGAFMNNNVQIDLATSSRKAFIKSVDASNFGYVYFVIGVYLITFILFARGGL